VLRRVEPADVLPQDGLEDGHADAQHHALGDHGETQLPEHRAYGVDDADRQEDHGPLESLAPHLVRVRVVEAHHKLRHEQPQSRLRKAGEGGANQADGEVRRLWFRQTPQPSRRVTVERLLLPLERRALCLGRAVRLLGRDRVLADEDDGGFLDGLDDHISRELGRRLGRVDRRACPLQVHRERLDRLGKRQRRARHRAQPSAQPIAVGARGSGRRSRKHTKLRRRLLEGLLLAAVAVQLLLLLLRCDERGVDAIRPA